MYIPPSFGASIFDEGSIVDFLERRRHELHEQRGIGYDCFIHVSRTLKKQPNPHLCAPPSFRFLNYATTTLSLISSKDVIVSFMSYKGLEPIALSMSQGTGPQSSEGSNSSVGQTSPDFSGACFSSDEETNPYDGILNLQAPDFTTVRAIVHGEGYWTEVAMYFQDPDFATLLSFMNSLWPETVEDDLLAFDTLVNIKNTFGQETEGEDIPYDVVKVLLNVDDVSEEFEQAGADQA